MSTDGAKGKLVHKHKKTRVNDCPTFKSGLHSRLDVGRSPFAIRFWAKGRVAESGLRHSTRNRASRYNGTVGSNPTPSAMVFRVDVDPSVSEALIFRLGVKGAEGRHDSCIPRRECAMKFSIAQSFAANWNWRDSRRNSHSSPASMERCYGASKGLRQHVCRLRPLRPAR